MSSSCSSSVGENENPSSCEMEQKLISLQEDEKSTSSTEELVHQSIRKMISKSVKELIAECRAKREEIDSSDVSEPTSLSEPFQRQEDHAESSYTVKNQKKPKGRRIKNVVVGEKVVFFTLPDDFNAENIKDIEKVKERLGKWRIQRRRRGSKLTDTYYRHMKSSLTFRSIKEVSNFIIHESVPVNNQKRKQVETVESAESCSKKVKEDSTNVEEAISKEPVENIVDSINPTENILDSINDDDAKSVIFINSNSADENVLDHSHLDKFYCDLQLQTYEELNDLQFEPCDDLPTIFSRKYNEEILKENSAEMHDLAWIETEVEANILTTEEATSNEQGQKVKENSEAEGMVEEDDFKDDIYDQLQDLNMGWNKKSDTYGIFDDDDFVEYDLLNNSPFDVDDVPDDLEGK